MSNIHGLYSNRDDDSDSGDDSDNNNRYVGGVDARGGGSGLAVQPNPGSKGDARGGESHRDAVFRLASAASSSSRQNNNDNDEDYEQDSQPPTRTITMYRNGFVVDNGPYRRLDDPNNAEFLQNIAMGRVPPELRGSGSDNVTVNLLDKRQQEYVEPVPTFASFSGTGNSLRVTTTSTTTNQSGVFEPSLLPPPLDTTTTSSSETTSIQVRMSNGQRRIVRIPLTATVEQLAATLEATEPFRLVTGFPPRPLLEHDKTIQECGLQGAQVMMQKI